MPKIVRTAQSPSELRERNGGAKSHGIVVALAGNPNSGKTTVFNNLTGGRQHVGNYPGVTVERKEGVCRHGEVRMRVIDLPGTYSLTAYSSEEVVARDFIIDERPDVVVDVIDSSNLERNLYLAVQIMELGVPLVLAFNMSDAARAQGCVFDTEKLSDLLGPPIVQTVGHRNLGMDELLDAVVATAQTGRTRRPGIIDYGSEIEEEVRRIQNLVTRADLLEGRYDSRWLAMKVLENDTEMLGRINSPALDEQLEKSISHLRGILGEHPETAMAGRRYGYISGACQEAMLSSVEIRHTMSDRIDDVAINPVLGLPIFMGLMYLVFHLTFTLGDSPMGWIEAGFAWFGGEVESWWPADSDSALKSLLLEGVIGGVGGVIVFLPNILLLFMAIAVLEDSGYMARAAFIMDRVMHKIGLHGKSFIPMLIGFGCSVPAIMATRSLENRRDRLTTMLVVPLMSCGARLPIYALIGTALIGAFAAKEVFVAQMGIVYAVGEADEESPALRDQLKARYSPLVAFCIMLFCLISAPCMATIAITKRESNSWRWALFQLVGLTAVACVLTIAVYQIGSVLGIGVT